MRTLPSWPNHPPAQATSSCGGEDFNIWIPGGWISVYEYQGDRFKYMDTRETDFSIWIPGGRISVYGYQGDGFQYRIPERRISVYEYQGDRFQYMNTRGTQTIRLNNGIMTLPTSVEFWSYYTFLLSLSKGVFSVNVCVCMCVCTYTPYPPFIQIHIYLLSDWYKSSCGLELWILNHYN